LQAYVFPWMIPPALKAAAVAAGASKGGTEILIGTGIFVLLLGVYASMQGRNQGKVSA